MSTSRCDGTLGDTIASSAGVGTVALVVLFAALFTVYFLPTLIANSRRHYNTAAIFALNLLLGWTFIGWVVALVMALSTLPPSAA